MTRMRLLIAAAVAVLLVVGGLAWFLGFFSDAPGVATIDAAVEAATGDTAVEAAAGDTAVEAAAGDTDPDPPGEATEADQADTDPGADEGISGTWSIQPNEATFVGYRIDEVLTTVGDFEVVGRTPDVTGSMEADGTTIESISVVARMDTLTTDSASRDRAARGRALNTDEFPEATFELTEPIELATIPEPEVTVEVTATGDLTIKGVTRSVEFPLEAQRVDDLIVVVGQIQVLLADFGIEAPTAPIVASVEDNATVELSLILGRS